MTPRRLSVEPLEERSVPAVISDLFANAVRSYGHGLVLQDLTPAAAQLADPSVRPLVQSFFTQVGHQAARTLNLLGRSPGGLPLANYLLGQLATVEANIARSAAARLGFNLGGPAGGVAPRLPPPLPGDAGMTNTMPDPNAPNWVAQPNGLKVWDVVVGTGTPVAAGGVITVFYTGWLVSNGVQFDARRSPQPPATFSLNSLIAGWQQGVPGMRPGGIRRLYIPAALAYGPTGSPPTIPPNADLIFEIKLVSVAGGRANLAAGPANVPQSASTVNVGGSHRFHLPAVIPAMKAAVPAGFFRGGR